MRVSGAALSALLMFPLVACGIRAEPEARPTATVGPAQTGYDPCDLLDQKERDDAAGVVADFEGVLDFYFPAWTCTFGDAPGLTSEASVQYQAMRAGVWAAKVPYLVDTTPAEFEPEGFLERALKRAGRAESELASLSDTESCEFWNIVQTEVGIKPYNHLVVGSETAKDKSWQSATAMTCAAGVFAMVVVVAEDADSEAGQRRAVQTLGLVLSRARTMLPEMV